MSMARLLWLWLVEQTEYFPVPGQIHSYSQRAGPLPERARGHTRPVTNPGSRQLVDCLAETDTSLAAKALRGGEYIAVEPDRGTHVATVDH